VKLVTVRSEADDLGLARDVERRPEDEGHLRRGDALVHDWRPHGLELAEVLADDHDLLAAQARALVGV